MSFLIYFVSIILQLHSHLLIILSMSLFAAIGLQMMELIADKKGIDKNVFDTLRADLDKMKKEVEDGPDGNSGSANGNGGQHRPSLAGERDSKRPRV
jgi:hypothetical protein